MTRFTIGLLLGLLLGIGGTAAFLISAGGGDYLIVSSPRVRELEASLKNVDQDRQWLRARLNESNDTMAKLESRFSTLAARFETMSSGLARDGGAIAPLPSADPTALPTPSAGPSSDDADAGAAPGGAPLDPSTAPIERPEREAREPAAAF